MLLDIRLPRAFACLSLALGTRRLHDSRSEIAQCSVHSVPEPSPRSQTLLDTKPQPKSSEQIVRRWSDLEIFRCLCCSGIAGAPCRAAREQFNPAARNGPYWGLMQMLPATARGMGHDGSAKDLLDAETNLKYGVRYLAGAYKVADYNPDQAVRLYSRGYYFQAKRKGMLDVLEPASPVETAAASEPAPVAGNTAVTATAADGNPAVPAGSSGPPRNSLSRAIKSFFPRWSPCRSSGPKSSTPSCRPPAVEMVHRPASLPHFEHFRPQPSLPSDSLSHQLQPHLNRCLWPIRRLLPRPACSQCHGHFSSMRRGLEKRRIVTPSNSRSVLISDFA